MGNGTDDTALPPSFNPLNAIELDGQKESRIVGVSLYGGRAEITRLFIIPLKTGQNLVKISSLPNTLDRDSLKVEGRGNATIHEVIISDTPAPDTPESSTILEELQHKENETKNALERCEKSIGSLERYMSTLSVQHVDVTKMGQIVDGYERNAKELDDRKLALIKELKGLDEEIKAEKEKLVKPVDNERLRVCVSVGVFAGVEGDVTIALVYAVQNASWTAKYDIRVDTQTEDAPVNLVYKASITQDTGEDWTEIPLTLETANPTFGLSVPTLNSWTIHKQYHNARTMSRKSKGFSGTSALLSSVSSPPPPARARSRAMFESYDPTIEDSEAAGPGMDFREANVSSSKGSVNATFQVPGTISVPSDKNKHDVTIVQLELGAEMMWMCVPKMDAKVHLTAKIKNDPDYALLRGEAGVYVDGSFVSRSTVPAVSPLEKFDCPLGLDPSIRVTYHPLRKHISQSGFYSKTRNQEFVQAISIFNSKASVSVDKLKIIEQIPVSIDSDITVKLMSPDLTAPSSNHTASGSVAQDTDKGEAQKALKPTKIEKGVVAQWVGSDLPVDEIDLDSLGKDGKFEWICSVPAQGKMNLQLKYEVAAPVKVDVFGL